jgi:hydrogenase maturation protein HypF
MRAMSAPALDPAVAPRVRTGLRVTGRVQGVGFRPFVHGLARRLALAGLVRNEGDAVWIEVEGPEAALAAFTRALRAEAPALAEVVAIEACPLPPAGEAAFRIEASRDLGGATPIPPDVALCADCARELADPADRRHRHPFVNCTRCGPRFTVITALPYDRERTTMAPFAMCDACAREYHDPGNRRFHAEPIACPDCGPQLAYHEGDDPAAAPVVVREVALTRAIAALRAGRIVAVKGIGGYHLACDARHEGAVRQLRVRKQRAEKPLAVMVPSLAVARELAHVGRAEAAALEDPARPIVLLERRADARAPLAPSVAPGQDRLGLMLPYAPLHHLLLVVGPLVMTSGNLTDEPIAFDDADARTRLGSIADAFLVHDRPIHVPVDDSVVTLHAAGVLPLRRARGYAPVPVALPASQPPVLAVGGEMKAAACLTRDAHAFLTAHVGDMGTLESLDALDRAVTHLATLFRVTPALVACDAHPAYHGAAWARRWAAAHGCPVVPVQHHHAHVAALMAEHGLDGQHPIIGFAFDGTGYGTDGTIWGGEVLVAEYRTSTRVAHLAPTPLPGGDAAIRRPARTALAQLHAAGLPWDESLAPVRALDAVARDVLARQLATGAHVVPTSSLGRFLDAAAALIGVRQAVSYEGQAAMELEALARRAAEPAPRRYAFSLTHAGGVTRFDGAPVLAAIVEDLARGVPPATMAAAVHAAVADLIVALAHRVRVDTGITTVGLTGGVFQNTRLVDSVVPRLVALNLRVLVHRLVPPNDGGLALGQAVIAGHAGGMA